MVNRVIFISIAIDVQFLILIGVGVVFNKYFVFSMGCLLTLLYIYDKKLEAMGIKCCVSNPLIPVLTLRLNNWDYWKIAIIDMNIINTCQFFKGER